MPLRFADMDPAVNGMKDFVPRDRKPTIIQTITLFVAMLFIAVAVSVGIDNTRLQAASMSLVLLITAWYVLDQTQRNRDLVLATEFQNALFASALGLYNRFCMIIRKDGTIVYLDRSFQDLFPNFTRQSSRTLDMLLELGAVDRGKMDTIFSAVQHGVYEKVVFKIRDNRNEWHNVVLSIEPIMRPSGFILLRGREFVENRESSDDINMTDAHKRIDKSTITLFSYIMDTMNMGVYMTGPTGQLIYVNPVLEKWLEYSDGEILGRNLSLQDIVHDDTEANESINPADYEGDVMLLKKTGGQMKSFINQKIIYDNQKKPIGCTALVHNFIEDIPNSNRKLW